MLLFAVQLGFVLLACGEIRTAGHVFLMALVLVLLSPSSWIAAFVAASAASSEDD
jgi:hypothetical protein